MMLMQCYCYIDMIVWIVLMLDAIMIQLIIFMPDAIMI